LSYELQELSSVAQVSWKSVVKNYLYNYSEKITCMIMS